MFRPRLAGRRCLALAAALAASAVLSGCTVIGVVAGSVLGAALGGPQGAAAGAEMGLYMGMSADAAILDSLSYSSAPDDVREWYAEEALEDRDDAGTVYVQTQGDAAP